MSQTPGMCEVEAFDPQRVQVVQGSMPDEPIFQVLSSPFKALADPSRLKIISSLSVIEFCVCDLAKVVG